MEYLLIMRHNIKNKTEYRMQRMDTGNRTSKLTTK